MENPNFDSRTLALLSRLATRKRDTPPASSPAQAEPLTPGSKGHRPRSAAQKDGQIRSDVDADRAILAPRATSSYGKRPSTSDVTTKNPRPNRQPQPHSHSLQPKTFEFLASGAQMGNVSPSGVHSRFLGGINASRNNSSRRTVPSSTLPTPTEQNGGGEVVELERRPSTSHAASTHPIATTATHTTWENSEAKGHEERILFAESPSMPGVVMCYRSKEEKAASPERLNLDRRKMTMCPLLEGEERLRLLNYQHNLITKIDNLHNLPNLIFLDLYNNQITQIRNLESLTTLRVLMLGKNQISKIENMQMLTRLDVLDLHSNNISKIENLNNLGELRVLNLAGNQISVVDNLEGLLFLTELNLRRNQIGELRSVEALPCLQRLFLSNNALKTFESLAALFKSRSLTELALDANPVAQEQHYRQIVLDNVKTLRHLDLKRVTEEERRQAWIVARKEEERIAEEARREQITGERLSNIQKAQLEWEAKKIIEESSGSTNTVSNSNSNALMPVIKDPPAGFAEIVGDKENVAHIYGKALDVLDKNPNLQTVVIKYVSFQRIKDGLSRLCGLTQLCSLTIANSDITSLLQLNHLVSLTQLRSLTIEENPVCTSLLVRPYVIYKYPNLLEFNGIKITAAEREQAAIKFDGYHQAVEGHFHRADQAALQSTISLQLLGLDAMGTCNLPPKPCVARDARHADFAAAYVDSMIGQTVLICDKLRSVDEMWEETIAECVRSALVDMHNVPEDPFAYI